MMRLLKYVVLMAIVLGMAGCKTRPPSVRRPIIINFDPALEGASIVVHVLALDTDRAMSFHKLSMTTYWNPNKPFDDYDYITRKYHFDGDTRKTFTIETSDIEWKWWEAQGADYLFVLANQPGIYEDKDGIADGRRCIVPLDPAHWKAFEPIRIDITPKDIFLRNRMQRIVQ